MPPKTATTAQQSRDKSERIRDQAARKAQEKQAAADELARNPPPEGKKTGKKGNGTTGRGKKKDDQQHPKGGRGNVKAAANKNAAKMTKDTQTTDPQQANRNESQAATSIFKPGLIHYLDLLPPYMRNDPQGVQDVITDLKRKAGVLEGADGDEEPEEPEGQQRPPKKKRKGHYGKPTHDKRGNDDSDDDDGAPGPSGSRGNASEPINVETAGENDDENAEEDGDRDNGRAPETPVDEATRAAEQEEEEVDTPESAEHPPAKRSETKATENEQEKPPPAYPEGFKRKGKQKATEEPAGSGDATLQAAARKIARNPSKMAGKGPIKCVTPSLTQKVRKIVRCQRPV